MRAFQKDSAEIIRATQGEIVVYYIPIGKAKLPQDGLPITKYNGAYSETRGAGRRSGRGLNAGHRSSIPSPILKRSEAK